MFGGGRNLQLFRAFGIQVSADWSWLIALGYVMFVMVGDYQQMLGADEQNRAFVYGVVVAFAFFGSIILHEFGHAFVARRNGIGILGIDLWLLGGLARMDREPNSPGVEFRVAAAGPAVTLLLAAALLGGAFALHEGPLEELRPLFYEQGLDPTIFALTTLGWINVFLLLFNLIPAYPLDGGRIARAAIWALTGSERSGTMISAMIGRWFGWAMILVGVLFLLQNLVIAGVLFMFMGWSLSQTASAARFQEQYLGEARHLTVAEVMDRQPVAMPADTTAQRALDEFFWRYRWPWFPVVDTSGRFIGLIEQHRVDMLEPSELDARRAVELIQQGSADSRAVRDDTPITALLANEQMRDHGSLMVVTGSGQLSGVITLEQVQRALRDAIARAGERHPPPGAPGP